MGWQALTASACVPCRPGRGLPKAVVPLLAPQGPRPLKWPFGSCLWSSWTESRLRPLTSQFFLSTSVTQGPSCPLPFQGSLEQADQWGEEWGTSFHLCFLEGTQEPLVPGLLSFCVMLQQGEDGGWGVIYFACPYPCLDT